MIKTPNPKWANRVLDDSDIERTPEYEQFIEKLRAYHEKRGTTLTEEPELGRKKVDLLKLYKRITEEGGYDKVTEEKGRWRDIALTYKLTGNTTNSGYLLKTIYYKNLAAYEISNFFGKEPPPKEWLEDRTAAGGAIQTRTAADFEESSEPEKEKSPTPPPPPGSGRSLRQAPPKREFYQPPIGPVRQSPARSAMQMNANSAMGHPVAHSGSPPRSNSILMPPSITQSGLTQPLTRGVSTPANDPERFAQRTVISPESYPRRHPQAATPIGPSELHRCYMSLLSGIKTEVQYALSRLVELSTQVPVQIASPHFPDMVPFILKQISEASELAQRTLGSEVVEGLDVLIPKDIDSEMNTLADALLVLRNVTNEEEAVPNVSQLEGFREAMLAVMVLPDSAAFAEVKGLALDTVANTAPYWVLIKDDPLVPILLGGIYSDDRSVIRNSLESLMKLGEAYELECLSTLDVAVIEHVYPWLMLGDDTEFLLAVVQFINKYISFDKNFEKLSGKYFANDIVKQLVRLLEYGATIQETTRALYTPAKKPKRVHPIPNLPTEIMHELLVFSEPERATRWMQCCFEEDMDSALTQVQFWQAYSSKFQDYVAHGRPILPAADFIKHVSVAFRNAAAKIIQVPNEQPRFVIQGIRAREAPVSVSGVVYQQCKWTWNTGHCDKLFSKPQDMYYHIIQTHLPPPDSGSNGNTSPALHCCWNGCKRFGAVGSTNRQVVIAHIRTHMPDARKPGEKPRSSPKEGDCPAYHTLRSEHLMPLTDATGRPHVLPLIIILTLRNFARTEEGRELLYPHRDTICDTAEAARGMALGADFGRYLMELYADSDVDPRETGEEEGGGDRRA